MTTLFELTERVINLFLSDQQCCVPIETEAIISLDNTLARIDPSGQVTENGSLEGNVFYNLPPPFFPPLRTCRASLGTVTEYPVPLEYLTDKETFLQRILGCDDPSRCTSLIGNRFDMLQRLDGVSNQYAEDLGGQKWRKRSNLRERCRQSFCKKSYYSSV